MIDDEAHQPIQQRQIDLLVDLLQFRLEHHDAFSRLSSPDLFQIIHALAPLVHQQRRRLRVGGLDPVREQMTFIGLVPEVLVEVRVLRGIDIVAKPPETRRRRLLRRQLLGEILQRLV